MLQTIAKRVTLAATALVTLAAAAPPADISRFIISPEAATQAKVVHEISRATARQIADACIRRATERNTPISLFILSPAGQVVFADRMDGQGPVNIETALMKAKTALYMRSSTHQWMNVTIQQPEFAIRTIPLGQFWNSGGLPIIVNNILIGSIGVGGMPATAEWSDEICAHQALTEVLGPQPPLAPLLPPRAP